MTLSARNQLQGRVTNVETDSMMGEVTIEVGDGQAVTALITASSVDRLDIAEGDDVEAVVKATEVMVEK